MICGDLMGDLSKHFSQHEFACKDRCGYGQPHPELIARLERLRAITGGKPLDPISGLRCPPHNAAQGGSKRSRHCSGEAADLEYGRVKERDARAAGFTGIGLRGVYVVHVDVRRGRDVTVWTY